MDAKPPEGLGQKGAPSASALPESRSVLLLVDFINPLDFDKAEDIAPAALAAAKMTLRLKRHLALSGVATIYANDNYGVWRSQFGDVLARCRAEGGVAGEMAELLAPGPHDLTILKPRHSAFYGTPLELLLAKMRTRALVVCGLAADICVQVTAADAFLRGFDVWVPADCTAAESPERLEQALDWMRRTLQCATEPFDGAAAAHRLPRTHRG